MKRTGAEALKGAALMVAAGVAFVVVNVMTQLATLPVDWGGMGFRSTSDSFWQYAIAGLLTLPFLLKGGPGSLRTRHPLAHGLRVLLSALGVQAFVLALSKQVPLWQVIALVAASPFFILLGAKLFLGERVTADRWLAAGVGFGGVMLILQPWSAAFTPWALLPILAAALWAGASLMTKRLTDDESAIAITAWLLILMTPINLVISVGAGFEVPTGRLLVIVLAGGVAQFLAQYCLTRAYSCADASFLQPFDDLKQPLNIAVGFWLWGYGPEGANWLGIPLIIGASAYLLWKETRQQRAPV